MREERGSGTVLALGLVSILLLLSVFMAGLSGVIKAQQTAVKAADLAALAAADTARGLQAGDPCTQARQVAEANGAYLLNCASPPGTTTTVDVRIGSPIKGIFAFLGPAEAISRAGPPS